MSGRLARLRISLSLRYAAPGEIGSSGFVRLGKIHSDLQIELPLLLFSYDNLAF